MLIFGVFSFVAGVTRSPWWYVLLIWLPHAYVIYSNRVFVENMVGLAPAFPGASMIAALATNFLFYGIGRGAAYAWRSMRSARTST